MPSDNMPSDKIPSDKIPSDKEEIEQDREPRGFGEHTRGLSGEYAHEQGWGLNEPERTAQSKDPQDTDGGNDYDYGAQDFGDQPINMALQIDQTGATIAPATKKEG